MNKVTRFTTGLLADSGDTPEQLLQHLCAIQQQFSYIPEPAIQQLADSLSIYPAQIRSVIDFYSFLHTEARGDFDILFSNNITDRMNGSLTQFDTLCHRLNVKPGIPRADGRVTIDTTSCTGICDQGPALLINGIAVSNVDSARIDSIAELVETGAALTDWPAEFFHINDNIQLKNRILNSSSMEGNAIRILFERGPDHILSVLEQSGLRGRGGAGFPTATKWRICRDTIANHHYVVCNADEGEPGTFKDRVLLNRYANTVIEGMTLCAAVIGAEKGYLYLRGEYRYLLAELESVLMRRRNHHLLGKNILGQPDFHFDIDIHLGAGAYICGEESALIESLEGKRGIPRNRPPYPVTCGFHNQPTVVNNVETFVAAANIAESGVDWLRSTGTGQSPGTKLLSISGNCERPGIYEYPFGTSVEQILDDCGAVHPQAIQVAGAAGTTLPTSEFNRTIAYEDLSTGGSFMVIGQQQNLLEMVQNFSHFFCHESCGFCTPCRVGGQLLKNLVDKVVAGHATAYDLTEMQNIGRVMQQSSHCGLGATAANPVLDTLKKFSGVYSKQLANTDYEPAFNLDAAVEVSRQITGRDDIDAYIKDRS
ncbi:MAG: NAD(P)H-dependent oxidoreductase subunit E [Gammaproteobacteria bacterium]